MGDNLKGSLLMTAAMVGFAVEDMFLKSATKVIPVGQALIIFGLAGVVIFTIMALRKGERLLHPAILGRAMQARSASEVLGRVFYTLAIALTPLSTASAILQAAPLVVASGAVIFLGEKIGWRQWTAIIAGFFGVLLILRPGTDGFEWTAIFAVLGMLGFAGRDLATRASPVTMSNRQLGIYGFAMLTLAGVILVAITGGAVWPDGVTWAKLVGATVFGVSGYYALTAAMRTGEIGVVAPFRYTRLVFAMILGVLVFAERPDAWTLIGSAVIVISGSYTFVRRRKKARAT